MMYPVCVVMILTVLFSLVEALLILPAHLATATDGGAPLSGTGFEPRPERLHAPMSFVIDPAQQRQANVTGGVQTPSGADQQSGRLDAWRARLNGGLECCVARYYRPLLEAALRWRYLTVALFAVFILLSVTLPLAGWVRLSLQADVTRDNFRVTLTPPPGTPFKDSRALAQRVEQALFDLRDSLDDHGARATTDDECHARHDRSPHPDPVMPDCPVRHPAGKCKSAPGGFVPPGEGEQGRRDFHYDCTQATGTPSVVSHLETIVLEREVAFYVEFSPDARQRYAIEDLVQDWRRRIGDIGRAKIDFLYRQGASPYDIVIEASAPNGATLAAAGAALQQALASYPGVYDVGDSYEPGKPEVRFQLKPEAERLGLRLKDVAEQVRRGFYGEEAQRFQRDGKDVKIFVRLPAAERTQLEQLRALPIRLPTGELAPLGGLANLSFSEGYAKLTRQDRRRLLQIRARVDKRLVDVNAVYAELESGVMQRLQRQQPDLKLAVGKERQEQKTMLAELGRNSLIALVVIYALIAVPFRSYSKPLIFLLAAPVAWSGAVLAHGLCGLPLSMESLVGMIAASGVVVNDSLVLLDYIREREGGLRPETGGRSAADAAFHTDPFSRPSPVSGLILEACTARFRPILLAFLTNFAGFLPTLLESSAQAQFLIPMTLSLSAGLLVGMAASLLLTPVCYALLCER
ncbi:MAG: efflux RND transporter permease subunit [Methylococcaceae bacterium]|nr:MAG: efflux RND transporter permease subunit [Methylococcaceae bacterium]